MTHIPKEDLVFIPLGGAGEIGMNLNLYGLNGRWIMVDCGISFGEDYLPGVDIIMPDITFIEERAKNLEAIILTHAHEDHLGAVHHLWERLRVPVYATPFCAAMLEGKLHEKGLETTVPVHIVRTGDRLELGPFTLDFMGITHSIPESQAIAIRTPKGTILHTGDWKLDDTPVVGQTTDTNAFMALGEEGVLAMICDSTNVFVEENAGSEGDVFENLKEAVDSAEGRVAVTTFASNVARLETILKVAEATGRHAALVGRSLHRVYSVAKDVGYLKTTAPLVSDEDAAYLPPDKVLYLCTGCQGEPRGAMWRIATGEHRHVHLSADDTVIFSARKIPGNEISIARLQNALVDLGCHVVTPQADDIHVSGHPGRADLAYMYQWIQPKVAIPVHGEARHIEEHCDFARSLKVAQALSVRNGDVITLDEDGASLTGQVQASRWALDGAFIVPHDDDAIRERRRVSFNGMLMVTVVLSRTGDLMAPVQVQPVGLTRSGGGDRLLEDIERSVQTAVNQCLARGAVEMVEDSIRRAARQLLRNIPGRRTPIEVQLIQASV